MMGVAELLVTHPNSCALNRLPSLLTQLREEDLQHVLACLHAAEESSSSTVRSMAVWAIAAPKAPANQEEQNMIRRFALDADRPTALVGILALSRFPPEQEADVVAILEQISLGDDGEIADRICLLFGAQNGIDPGHLPKPFGFRFLEQLVALADWSQLSHVSDFIEWITMAEPERAAAYYLARIAHQRVADFSGYVAIPYQLYGRPTQGHAGGGITDSGARAQALRMVRDALLSPGSAPEIWEVTQVCSRLSLSNATLVLDVLLEWIDSNDPQRIINAAHLLPHGDTDFVFVHEGYVVHLLEMAHQQYATVFQQVQDAIIDSTQFGLSGGWGVGPHPENATQLSQATEASQRYPQGHVAHAFYQRLMNIALEIRERNNQIDAMLEDE